MFKITQVSCSLKTCSQQLTSFLQLVPVRHLKKGTPAGRLLYLRQNIGGIDPVECPRLTPKQVSGVLRMQEATFEPAAGAVKTFEINKLQANNPIEDRQPQAKVNTSAGHSYLFGVIDGHAGCACAQSVQERLFNYVAVAMAPFHLLDQVHRGEYNMNDLLEWYWGENDYRSDELKKGYELAVSKFANEILALHQQEASVEDNLSSAFMRLDQDIVSEALPSSTNDSLNLEKLHIAFSGACACVAYIDETDLYVANVGDTRAVLGVNTEEGEWEAVDMAKVHNAESHSEVKRIHSSHPNESANLIRNGRLFGDLAPLRAFGDVRYKWSVRDLKHILLTMNSPQSFISIYGNRLIPSHYRTPPYLTAEPDIVYHQLTPRDKFLVIASDGLWDMISPEKVVQLVAGHMDGKQVLVNFQLPSENLTLREVNELLKKRQTGLANKPVEANVATHLIRNALGPEHGRLSALLTLPDSIARFYRDDITVTVIFFDSDYIKNKHSS